MEKIDFFQIFREEAEKICGKREKTSTRKPIENNSKV